MEILSSEYIFLGSFRKWACLCQWVFELLSQKWDCGHERVLTHTIKGTCSFSVSAMFTKFYQCWQMTSTLCACVCECTHNGISFSSFLLYFPFSENSLCLSQSVLYMPQVVTDKTRLHFHSRVCPLLLHRCLLLWRHLPTVTKMKFQKGLQTSCKLHLPFLLHPKHRWLREKESFLLHVEHHLQSKLPQWHKTRDNGVTRTSLMNKQKDD